MVWTQLEREIYHNALAGRPTHCNREAVKGAFIRALMLDLDYAGDPEATVQSLVPYPKDHTSGKRTRLPMTGVRLSNATIIGKIDLRDGAQSGGDLLPALELVKCVLIGDDRFDLEEDIPDEDRPAFIHADDMPPATDGKSLRMTCLDISHTRLARLSLGHSRFSFINAFEALIDGPVDLQGVGPLDDWEDSPWPGASKDEIDRWFEGAQQETETRIEALVDKQTPDLPEAAETLLKQPEISREATAPDFHRDCHANFKGARIDGEANLSGGRFRSSRPHWAVDKQAPGQWTLAFSQAEISGDLNLSKAVIEGDISMEAAHIHGDCWMKDMPRLGSYAFPVEEQGAPLLAQCFRMDGAHFYGVLAIQKSCLFGRVGCVAAIVDGGLELTGSVVYAQENIDAINLYAIRTFRVLADGIRVLGGLCLKGATIEKECTFKAGFICGTFDLSSTQMGGNLDLMHLTIDSEAKLRTFYRVLDVFLASFETLQTEERATILKEFESHTPEDCLRNSRKRQCVALLANNLTIAEDLMCSGMAVLGAIRFFSAMIGKDASVTDCKFACQDFSLGNNTALYIKDTTIDGKLELGKNHLYGDINLAGTHCETLNDYDGYAYGCEFTRLVLDGFTYQRLEEPEYIAPNSKRFDIFSFLNMRKAGCNRKAWLKRMPVNIHATQPYIQLYRTLVLQGLLADGRAIRILKFNRDNFLSFRRNFWGTGKAGIGRFFTVILGYLLLIRPAGLVGNGLVSMYGFCFGYGLKPNRAAATLIISLLAGWGFVSYLDYRNALIVDQQPVAGYVSTSGGGSTRQLGAMSISHVDDKVPCGDNINTFLYALDVFVPLIDLHQESRCEVDLAADVATRTPPLWRQTLPSPRLSILPSVKLSWVPFEVSEISVLQLVKSLYALLGWVITSLAVVTFSGILQRKDDDL